VVKRKVGAYGRNPEDNFEDRTMASTATLQKSTSEMARETVTELGKDSNKQTPGGGKRKLTPLPVSQPVKEQNAKAVPELSAVGEEEAEEEEEEKSNGVNDANAGNGIQPGARGKANGDTGVPHKDNPPVKESETPKSNKPSG